MKTTTGGGESRARGWSWLKWLAHLGREARTRGKGSEAGLETDRRGTSLHMFPTPNDLAVSVATEGGEKEKSKKD